MSETWESNMLGMSNLFASHSTIEAYEIDKIIDKHDPEISNSLFDSFKAWFAYFFINTTDKNEALNCLDTLFEAQAQKYYVFPETKQILASELKAFSKLQELVRSDMDTGTVLKIRPSEENPEILHFSVNIPATETEKSKEIYSSESDLGTLASFNKEISIPIGDKQTGDEIVFDPRAYNVSSELGFYEPNSEVIIKTKDVSKVLDSKEPTDTLRELIIEYNEKDPLFRQKEKMVEIHRHRI